MGKEMLVCAVCKTPIEFGLEIKISESEYVHPCTCHAMHKEMSERLNESATDAIAEVQMIM
ncbi:MAG: DUF2685 domain-containing protein [Bacilli bacterium]